MIKRIIFIGIFCIFSASLLHAKVLYTVDFSKESNGKASESWWESKGFKLQRDADEMSTSFKDGVLHIETDDDILGLFSKEVDITGTKRLRITWGINQFPDGADWEEGTLREAISLVITFGTEKIESGSSFVPDVPYFISIFIGEKEKPNKVYLGNYYKEGGRYYCVACGSSNKGKTITTDFEFHEKFKKEFKTSSVPTIKVIAFEIDVRDTKGDSKSFIKKVEFLDN